MYGADDFLPVLTYVIAQCDMLELDTEIEYMMELLDPSLLHGEGNVPWCVRGTRQLGGQLAGVTHFKTDMRFMECKISHFETGYGGPHLSPAFRR